VSLLQTYARYDVRFERGEGARLWDDAGNEYLDFLCGISVSSVGHCHPAVVAAVREQAGRLMHVGNLFYTEPMERLADRLTGLFGGGEGGVFFTNSGAEAVEAALKLGRKAKQGGDVITAQGAFHGRTYGALSATPQESKQAPFAPLVPGFRSLEPAAIAESVDSRTALVLIEPIQGETGIHVIDDEVLRAIREACDRVGAALIFDEIQCGVGRSGTFTAAEFYGVTPDAITMAKGLASGFPMAATVVNDVLAEGVASGDLGSTFGGGPLACAAGLATLEVIEQERLVENAATVGAFLRYHALNLGLGVQGHGLLLGLRLPMPAAEVQQRLFARRILTGTAGDPAILRLLPPLSFSQEEAQLLLEGLRKSLA